uniref:C-type lectin domain-containing protein n=1 Tax=Acrobeloides nanus TaxID=290746 RepID=A0A914E1G0_9BILA
MYRETRKTIYDADNDCQALGGFLASIHGSATNKLIGAQLKKMDTYANKSVWIGGLIEIKSCITSHALNDQLFTLHVS